MTPSQRLRPVVRLSQSGERDAAKRLSESRRVLKTQEARLKELERYRREYGRFVEKEGGAGVGADRLRNYLDFLTRLNRAISYQQRKVREARCACELSQQAWLAARRRRKAIDKVVEAHRRRERRAEAVKEQREADEHAQNRRPGRAVGDG